VRTPFESFKPKGRDYLVDLGINWRIMLNESMEGVG
jgi:hypothetical protein